MDNDEARDPVRERLKELFPSCETDCTEGCKYGCLGWLHRFDPPGSVCTEREPVAPDASEGGSG